MTLHFAPGRIRSLSRHRARSPLVIFMLLILTLGALPASLRAQPPAPAAALPKPENIACQGWERDTIIVSWKDTATDETNYRVERSIGGAAFAEVATIAPNGAGNYDAYRDMGADVSTQNRRYRVRSYRSGDTSFSPYSDVCNNRRIFETSKFRIFYGLRGTTDDCPLIDGQQVCLTNDPPAGTNKFVQLQADALQGSGDAFARLGFARPATDPPGGLDRIPINVVWCDGGGCAGGSSLGLSPFLMETPFDTTTRVGDPIAWAVALHELFHFQQFKYWGLNDPADGWVVEGQARSIQDKICVGPSRDNCQNFDDIDTGYAGYVPEVKGYLGNTVTPVNQASYQAALFWTYLTEKYGTSSPADTVEAGMNLIIKFWEESAANPGRDGIAVLNSALTTLGHSERFRDIWKDFAVANYAKDLTGSGVPAKYHYADMQQPGGNYGPVALTLSKELALGAQEVNTDQTVRPWSARYYELRPAANVPVIDIKIKQDSTVPVYYTILGIKGNNLDYEYNVEARDLDRTLVNDGYSKVMVVVAGLENLANYRYSFNGTQPTLRILSPTTANKARVGSPAAPDKFRVAVEVVAPNGTPLAGVDPDSFSFRVGTQDVPAGNILTAATVQGQQWFVLRAPTQAAAGTYDLRVRYSTILTGTQSQAVDYSPRLDADSVLVIDRSGSMAAAGKIDAAKTAARLFVDSWRSGDKIGVVSFSDASTTNMTLRDWTDTPAGGSRATAFTAINGLSAVGGTWIGGGLDTGWSELKTRGNAGHDWALVLLSDGLENPGVSKTFQQLIDEILNTTGKRPVIHTVAVGPDADRPRMQSAANATGGTYQYVSAPATTTAAGPAAINDLQLDMDSRYRAIATKIAGQQQFFSLVGPINDGNPDSDTVQIPVEGSAAEMVLSLSWKTTGGLIGTIQLRDPSNTLRTPTESDTRHVVWRIPTPAKGNWTLFIQTPIIGLNKQHVGPAQTVEYLPPYLVQGALRSDVTLDVYLPTPVEQRKPGVPMPIVASLTDTGPIKGANVIAAVQQPFGIVVNLKLYDDGAHGDGAKDDGIYANTFLQTGQGGSYNVNVTATGTSPLSGPFTRQDVASFHLGSTSDPNGIKDSDGDGLPDDWEIRFGTNPNVNDASADPDNDGSSNSQEWQRGTDPHNADTDGGGEADGTDPNPLDPSDDRIQPTWAIAYPGVGKVFIRYALRPQYAFVGIFRATNPNGPFIYIGQNTPGTGIFTDTAVVNGTTYCYVALALDTLGRRSASLAPSCATPKADPLSPHGWVQINGGAPRTGTPNVRLILGATDTIDPESERPEGTIPQVPLPPDDSATGVKEMLISNQPDFAGATWQPYVPTRAWTLGQLSGLAAVYVKYRDFAGNESDMAVATIHVQPVFLPIVRR